MRVGSSQTASRGQTTRTFIASQRRVSDRPDSVAAAASVLSALCAAGAVPDLSCCSCDVHRSLRCVFVHGWEWRWRVAARLLLQGLRTAQHSGGSERQRGATSTATTMIAEVGGITREQTRTQHSTAQRASLACGSRVALALLLWRLATAPFDRTCRSIRTSLSCATLVPR